MTGSNENKTPERPYLRALSILRQAPKGTSVDLMDKLMVAYFEAADMELPNATSSKSRRKLYIATITALIDYLNVREIPHEVLSTFQAELNNRALGLKGQFTFDAEVGRKGQTLEEATRLALILAYYEAFPKERNPTYKLAKKYLGLSRAQVVQRAADARKGKKYRDEIENLREWAKRKVKDPNFDKNLYFPDN